MSTTSPAAVPAPMTPAWEQPFLVWDALKMLFAALTVTGIFTLAKKRS